LEKYFLVDELPKTHRLDDMTRSERIAPEIGLRSAWRGNLFLLLIAAAVVVTCVVILLAY
jgi:hypothetical protein